MARDIVLVSFDYLKSDYDFRSYSISSILASLKKHGVSASHYCININQVSEERLLKEKDIEDCMNEKIDDVVDYLMKFKFISIGVARWSKNYVKHLISTLKNKSYSGKIICGSYEITATDDKNLVEKFGDADFFIKGYAEKPLVKLIKENCYSSQKVINEPLDPKYLASPYQEGIIPLYSRKIYWETKRGCKFSCGFCEWGNRGKKDAIDIDEEVLREDIKLFSNSNVEEINILDGTFNIGDYYIGYLSDLLNKTDCKITFQTRFEAINGKYKTKFLSLCEKYKDRVHLEFGLQTIHKNEMASIGRDNDMEKVEWALNELNKRQISYEVSIIYAIPGQTIDSFIDTIEFLKINGCKTIRAFPLQIPENFDEERKKIVGDLQSDCYKIESVANSSSFTKFERGCMDIIAEHLNKDEVSDIRKELETIEKDRWNAIVAAYEICEYIRKEKYKDVSLDDLKFTNERLNSEEHKVDIPWIVDCWQRDNNFAKNIIAFFIKSALKLRNLTPDEVNNNPNAELEHFMEMEKNLNLYLNILFLDNPFCEEYNLDKYGRLVHLMKMIDSHKKKCEGSNFVYSIDNELIKDYSNKGLGRHYYLYLLYSDYINQYFKPVKVIDSDYKYTAYNDLSTDYFEEKEISAKKLKNHIEDEISDIENKSLRLSPVIRIGESGDFYVYAKARYYIGNNECKIKNIKINNKEYNAFRVLTLESWEQIREKIKDKCDLINIIVCQPKTIE